MEPGIYIVGRYESGGLSDPIDPDILADAGPEWKKDLSLFGPFIWQSHQSASGKRIDLFRAQNHRGPSTVFITGSCTSSMDVARKLLEMDLLPPMGSVLAVEQSAGRGQKMRNWVSPPGNIYGTWYWPIAENTDGLPFSWLPLASLLAGDVLATGLEQTGIPVKIKWPNDIISDQRKLCGILTENRGGHLLVGVGINVVSAPEDQQLRNDFVLPATSLNALKGGGNTPLSLWVHLVDSGMSRLNRLVSSVEPREFVHLIEKRMAWNGQKIFFRQGTDDPIPAVICGLAEDGGLRIQWKGREEIVHTGSMIPD